MGRVVFYSTFLLDQIGHPNSRPQLGLISSDLGSLLEFVLHASQIGRAEQWLSPGTPGFLKPPDSRLLNLFIPATDRLAVHSHLSRHLGLRYPAAQ